MSLRLAFDVRTTHETGISRYGLSILKHFPLHFSGARLQLYVLHRPRQAATLRDIVSDRDREYVHLIEIVEDEQYVRRSQWVRSFLLEEKIDLLYTTHYLLDPLSPVPFVYTIHDLLYFKYPELAPSNSTFSERFGVAELDILQESLSSLSEYRRSADAVLSNDSLFFQYFAAVNRCLATKAAHIVTVSQTSKSDITHYLGINESKISIVLPGVSREVFYRRDAEDVRKVQQQFAIEGPYCLYVGLGYPHKRLRWLTETLEQVKSRLPIKWRFIVVGGDTILYEDVAEYVEQSDLANFVYFTGRVTDEQLAALYSGASAYVTASLNEGNNLPPLEALNCGCEVIAPAIPSFLEPLGRDAHFYSVNDRERLGDMIVHALTGRLERKAVGSVYRPDWDQSAQDLLAVLENIWTGLEH